MSGFPIRPSRSSFGPAYQNRRPVRDPRKELDEAILNLLMWQVAGMGVVAPVAWALCTVTGTAIALTAHAEAWNADGSLTGPTPARTGVGVYTLQYAAQYADKDGVLQTLNLVAAMPAPQGLGQSSHLLSATPEKIDVRTFKISTVRQDTGAAEEATTFFVPFW